MSMVKNNVNRPRKITSEAPIKRVRDDIGNHRGRYKMGAIRTIKNKLYYIFFSFTLMSIFQQKW